MRVAPSGGVAGRALSAAVAAALLLGACAGGDDDGDGASTVVRSFEEVQDGEITVEADPGDPSSAVLRVTTTEPMICAVVWGEDDSYGRFNNSRTMEGTGIVRHDVVLPDVEAGTTYHYVLQGTTADGTLYRSEPMTFRLGTSTSNGARSGGSARVNLALAATVVEVSSEFSTSFGPKQALDGDLRTEWSTSNDGDRGFVVIDLGALRTVTGVEFVTRSMADGSAITTTFTVSVDGGAPRGPFPAATVTRANVADLAATGRVLRFDVDTSTGGNVGAVEIRVFG